MSISALGQGAIQPTELNPFETAQYRKTSVSSTQAAEIEIYTAEGDKFTLSSSVRTTAAYESYASYNSLGRTEEANYYMAQDSVSSQNYALSIEGNLNQKEMQDIHKALQTITQASTKMQSGNLDGAQNKLQKLEKLEALVGITANLTVEKTVTVESATTARINA